MNIVFLFVHDEVKPYHMDFIETVRKYMPTNKLIQLSDDRSVELEGVDAVIRRDFTYPREGRYVMRFRIEHILNLPFNEFIDIDTDVLLNGSISKLFEGDYDIAICRRHDNDGTSEKFRQRNPYNAGGIVYKNKEFIKDVARKFFRLKHIKFMTIQEIICSIIKMGDYRVKFFDGYYFNYTPSNVYDYREDVKLIHFKGDRKDWMNGYYEWHMKGK